MIILDTHAWIWWQNESPKLSLKAKTIINEQTQIGIPAICCWEVAMLVAKNRLGLSIDVQIWQELAFQNPKLKLLPINPEIAVLATRLPDDFHGDPADRLIVASCLIYQTALVSKDEKIQNWGHISIIW